MEHLHHFFQYGPVTAVIAYVMACIGAGLGLRCVIRAVEAYGTARQMWLLTAGTAIGSGIWIMHLIVMLGFGLEGSPVRYDVPLTMLSLLAAIILTGCGLFAVTNSRSPARGIVLGGLCLGLGIAGMHYLGTAAMQFHGTMHHDLALVAISVVIAVAAAMTAMWLALTVRGFRGTLVSALVMGAAATLTEYTGIAALDVSIVPGTSVLPGASAVEFIFPFIVIFGSFLFLSSAFVALSPHGQDRSTAPDDADADSRDSHLVS